MRRWYRGASYPGTTVAMSAEVVRSATSIHEGPERIVCAKPWVKLSTVVPAVRPRWVAMYRRTDLQPRFWWVYFPAHRRLIYCGLCMIRDIVRSGQPQAACAMTYRRTDLARFLMQGKVLRRRSNNTARWDCGVGCDDLRAAHRTKSPVTMSGETRPGAKGSVQRSCSCL